MTNPIDFNIDSLLDNTLDNLADMPTFEPFKIGAHKVIISFEGHKAKLVINKRPCLKIKMNLVETQQLADAADTPQAPGSEAEVLYRMDNELGQANFKKIMTILGEHFGKTSIRDIIEASEGSECLVITGQWANKDKTALYTDIKEIAVV